MADHLDALATEATRDTGPVFVKRLGGRTWRFGQPDLRPSRLRRLRQLADRLDASTGDDAGAELDDIDALELSALIEDLLRCALPSADREAFDQLDVGSRELTALAQEYFDALGVQPGESSASPHSSQSTVRRSRPTSPKRTRKRRH